jgi:hypothetical protein
VAAAGGWKSIQTLTKCYQQPDDATMLAVVLSGAELREKKALPGQSVAPQSQGLAPTPLK